MTDSRWICPHCEHAAFISAEQNIRKGTVTCANTHGDGNWVTSVRYYICPNPNCRLTTIYLAYGQGVLNHGHHSFTETPTNLRLRPLGYAKPIPSYVPKVITEDYVEACSIIELSPKAAATLARRALQGMIRDFHGVTGYTLAKEIEAIKDRIDPLIWQAIDAVRSVGNIGAHMEKDINVIVDVEPEEAVQLVKLIELLIKEWYVARHNRQEGLAAIIALNDNKQNLRKPKVGPTGPPSVEPEDGAPAS